MAEALTKKQHLHDAFKHVQVLSEEFHCSNDCEINFHSDFFSIETECKSLNSIINYTNVCLNIQLYNKMNNKEKILAMLFEHPSKEFHIRSLARLTKLNPNTIINITDALVKEGLILKQKDSESNLIIIKANQENSTYKLEKQFYNIKKIFSIGLIDHLNDELHYPTIILFGSYAKAENHENSDIDIFVIADEKKHLNLETFEKKLHAKIQLFIHTKNEFKRLKKTSPELINNVLNGVKLSGYIEVV